MIWVIECAFLCGVFTLLTVPALLKDPLSQIASYPPEIRERVRGLPEYSDVFSQRVRAHRMRKVVAAILLCFLFAALPYLAGKHGFGPSFIYVFSMFTVLNLYDLIVLDLIWFCHSMRVRIPRTEDMDQAYKNPKHHVVGAVRGMAIGIAVSAVAAALTQMARFIAL
jgi:hypothetical protein